MWVYSVIMFAAAAVLVFFGVLIYRGKTKLIQSYHQAKVSDKAAYGKAFGKSMLVIGAAPLFSGIIGLLGETRAIAVTAAAVLLVGIAAGVIILVKVQNKYNNGIF